MTSRHFTLLTLRSGQSGLWFYTTQRDAATLIVEILLIADPHIPVPPVNYGGAERIVALYAAQFRKFGHIVHLMAGPRSKSFGGRLHVHNAPSLAYHSRARRKFQFQVQSLWAARDCDVVYNFGRFDYLEGLLWLSKPLLHGFQNPIDQRQIDMAERRMGARTAFHFISKNQISHAQISKPAVMIHNPVDTSAYVPGNGEGGYLAFLGRLTFNKGVDVAIAVAKRTGRNLVIAGNISKEQGGELFFLQEIQPHLDGGQIRWIGPVNDQQKQELLSHAEALLFPIRWDEPFGIVMVEALACGCPVIATLRASAPEVIDHGFTGFLCSPEEPSVDAFVAAVEQLQSINRENCRHIAEQRFDIRQIAPKTLCVLNQLADGEAIDFDI